MILKTESMLMRIFFNKPKRIALVSILLVVLLFAILLGACAFYVGDYYRADTDAIDAFASMGEVTAQSPKKGMIVFEPENPVAGLIFYPGGKVEYTAYQPLLAACAEQGILCILLEMPFNLAVLDINAADGIREMYPQVERWYIGGHSLGGSMAASYLAKHVDAYDGLILLGSYATADLSTFDLDVLSVYGSEDKVMDLEKYNANKVNLPEDFAEILIDGGCHAYFGMYGAQDGDGVPTISNEDQIRITADAIAEMIKN